MNPSSSPTVLALLDTRVPDTTAEKSLRATSTAKHSAMLSVSSRAAGAAPLLGFLRRRHGVSSEPPFSRGSSLLRTHSSRQTAPRRSAPLATTAVPNRSFPVPESAAARCLMGIVVLGGAERRGVIRIGGKAALPVSVPWCLPGVVVL